MYNATKKIIFQINAGFFSFYLFIKESWKKSIPISNKNIKQRNCF